MTANCEQKSKRDVKPLTSVVLGKSIVSSCSSWECRECLPMSELFSSCSRVSWTHTAQLSTRERHRQTNRDTDRDRGRQTDRQRHRQTDEQTDRHTHRERETQRERERQTDTERKRQRQRQTETEIDRQIHTRTDRQTDTERETDRQHNCQRSTADTAKTSFLKVFKRYTLSIALNGNPSQSYGASPAIRDQTVLPASRHR